MRTMKHTVNGREYEIRSLQTSVGWEVGTFYGGSSLVLGTRFHSKPGRTSNTTTGNGQLMR